jgi:glutamate/tyrosine decarboxylase-like PLP-dependent enzyme
VSAGSGLGSSNPKDIIDFLVKLSREEPVPSSGMMFTHSYETGDPVLRDLARRAFELYMDKTMLDFTVYPSLVKLERDVVSFVARLMGGGESTAGTFTYGGTESIILAVKAARDFFKSRNPDLVPEIILPYTAHPAFVKAAVYLGLKPALVPVNLESFKVDLNAVQERVSRRTAMIVGSAPNYPVGVVDDIRGLSDIALDRNVWLHVDACIGGFVLPFFKDLGEPIPDFNFKVDGVYSISVDLHKYGYTPKGASVILYRDRSLRKYQFFAYSRWPGYPLVNTVTLSTRSAGPLAASWAVIKYLGYDGYLKLSSKILNAKKRLVEGIKAVGLKILGSPESSIIAFTSEEISVAQLSLSMKRRGWIIQVQPGSIHLGFPQSIHLTISPIHEGLVHAFLRDLRESVEEVRSNPFKISVEDLVKVAGIRASLSELVEKLGLSREVIVEDETLLLISEAIRMLPPDFVETMLVEVVNEIVF